MKAVRTLLEAIGGTAVVLVLGYIFFVGGQDLISGKPAASPPPAPSGGAMVSAGRADSFAAVVETAKPAVVNIATIQAAAGRVIRCASSSNATSGRARRAKSLDRAWARG
jgi:hypothetical protein